MGTKPTKLANRPSWPTKAANLGLFPVRAKVTEDLFQRGDLFLLSITRAHGGYTGRCVVGRGLFAKRSSVTFLVSRGKGL